MTSTTKAASATTTTTPAKKSNRPSHEIFTVEEQDNGATKWTRVGVAFPTQNPSIHRVLIGDRGDPNQRVYLVRENFAADDEPARTAEEERRRPFANVYDAKGEIDWRARDGVAFLNRDDSLTLLIGQGPDQVRYQMRPPYQPKGKKVA